MEIWFPVCANVRYVVLITRLDEQRVASNQCIGYGGVGLRWEVAATVRHGARRIKSAMIFTTVFYTMATTRTLKLQRLVLAEMRNTSKEILTSDGKKQQSKETE